MFFCSEIAQLLNSIRDILILLHIILIFFFLYLNAKIISRRQFFARIFFLTSTLFIILLIALSLKLTLPTLRPIFYCKFISNFNDIFYFNDSFPSSHTAISMALSLFAIYYLNQFKYLSFFSSVLTLVIAFLSYLSLMHWLSDIVVGALLGLFVFYVLHFLTRRYL